MAPTLGVVTAALVVCGAMLLAGWRRVRAAAWSGRLPWGIGALPVDDVPAEDAPRGYKAAQLLISPDGDRVRLAGIAVGGVYDVDDAAVCILGRSHEPPQLGCECGFYAFDRRGDATDLLCRRLGLDQEVVVEALCTVDLAGTVVVCDRGYRAGWQRVLDVGMLPWCASCASRGVLVRATVLGAEPPPAPVPRFTGRAQLSTEALTRLHPAARLRREWSALRPLCDPCADSRADDGPILRLVDVTGELGTEVYWLAPEVVPRRRVLAAHRPTERWTG